MSVEAQSAATVHLQKLLAEQNAAVQKLVGLLKPFAAKVIGSADELIVENTADPEYFIKAYYGVQKYVT